MPPPDDASETFAQWRIWIIKTLDKLSQDVESLKSLTHDRHEYMRRFEVVEDEIKAVRDKIGNLDVVTAVSRKAIMIYASIAAFIGSAGTAVILRMI
jgi:hypothetical protein